VPLEHGDDPAKARAVDLQRGFEVDHLRRVRVDAGRVRVGDEVHDVVAGEVDVRVGRGERVPEVGGPVRRVPVAAYGVRRRRPGHLQPLTARMGVERELAVRRAFEELTGGRKVIRGQLGRCGERGRVRE
jgi:hypothetical protein